ncbi:BTB/POZ domain-containing proteinisoform X1 [Iris pallida]|uniref:BTB/POZ domain-containing proteinisoform X1 n=1 Tax=Iris pallida TaxID=29817 RepID=A0AAX6GE87_IRIPA|nr:BTB/POZ domain-containing proteinisoform X1 [Iris pallida]
MYSKCGRLEYAVRVFDRMPERDLVVWNSMVSGYARRGFPDDAMALVKKMRAHGPKPDLVTWNALISGLSQPGAGADRAASASDLLASMRADGIEPDVYTWTSLVSGLVRDLDYDRAVEMFKRMVASGVRPSSATISSLLPALANAVNLNKGKELHCYAVAIGAERDLFVGSSLVDMYAKCGLILEAETVFGRMGARNAVSWNSMIFAYSNHGFSDRALALFDRMQAEGVRPDHLTFTAVFTACSHVGATGLGKDMFRAMQEEHGIEPRLEHYACMVDLLGRAGRLEEARDLIEEMPVKPDSFVWGALLGACRKHGNVDLAELASSRLLELEPESCGSFVTLSNVLMDVGRWEDAVRMNKLIRRRKLKRHLGCSWTQAGR